MPDSAKASSGAKDWGELKGAILLDSSETLMTFVRSQGFSVTGSRTLRLTDRPAVYIHDTGGLFGEEHVARLERITPGALRLEVVFKDGKPHLVIEATISKEKSFTAVTVQPLRAQVAEALWRFGAALAPEAGDSEIVTPLALPMALWFEDSHEEPAVPVRLSVRSGRLIAAPLSGKPAEIAWPLGRAVLSPGDGAELSIQGGVVVNGDMVLGATVSFPYATLRDRFMAATRKLAPTDAGSAAFSVGAKVAGGQFGTGREVEAVLTDQTLEFCSRDGATTLGSARFDDPDLRLAGLPERFVLYAPELGPVAVQVDAHARAFAERLLALPRAAAAATFCVSDGPYPLLMTSSDGPHEIPVIVRIDAGELSAAGRRRDRRAPVSAVRSIEPRFDGDWPTLTVAFDGPMGEARFSAPAQVLEAFHTAIKAEALAGAPVERVNDLLRAAVALEEDYFLHEVFGPCYELHAALVNRDWATTGSADLREAVTVPEAEEVERNRIAALFVAGLDELRRHFDRVAHLLPPVIRMLDGEVAAAPGARQPTWLKDREDRLRRDLAVTARAGAEVQQLGALAARASDFDPGSVGADFSGALVALGASFINPIFLVGAATQAFSQHRSSEARTAGMSEQARRVLRTLAVRWNAFVTELVPMLAYTITDGLFHARIETARLIAADLATGDAAAQAAGLRRIARRVARLDVRRRYPSLQIEMAPGRVSGSPLTRGDIVAHIRKLQSGFGAGRFASF